MMYGSLGDNELTAPLQGSTTQPSEPKDASLVRAARAASVVARLRRRKKQRQQEQQPRGVLTTMFPQEHAHKKKDAPSPPTQHSFWYTLLNPKSRQWQAIVFKKCLALVIVFDMVMFIMSTEPSMEQYENWFYIGEGVTSSLFLLEYIARLIVITESHKYSHPVTGRLKYIMSPSALVDAFATFPFFLELLTPLDLPRLTFLRFFRLFRIVRTDSFSHAADTCWRVIYYNREILKVAMVLCIYLVLITAVLLYYLRPPPKLGIGGFESIGSTMYMSTLMLTGQGGPEERDLPWYTKSVVLLTGVFSIGMFAIPASMLTWGFEAEAERVAKKTRRRAKHDGAAGTTTSSTSASEGDGSVSTSDEEYLNIIAGDDDEDEEILQGTSLTDRDKVQTLLERFKEADGDASGSLTKREFLDIAQGLTPDSGDMESRMRQLEARVEATNAKLDRILEIFGDY